MPKILEDWTVLPHGALEQADDGILTVAGDIPMPLGNFPRRMTVVRLAGGRSAIFSAIALPEPEMARIEALGTPAVMIVPVDATTDILDDPEAEFVVVAGTDARESAIVVRRPGGVTLIINDVIGHVRHPHGLGAHVMARLLGFGVNGPRIPRTAKGQIKNRPALAEQLRSWTTPDLKRIIVSHGDPITDDPAAVLRRIADGLD